MAHGQIDVADLPGTWRRSLLQDDLGRQDRTTDVTWVQGPSAFGDLRQPASLDAVRATCLRHLTPGDAALLAQQEGFGGILIRQADHFEWVRAIDYQPKGRRPDRGTLTWQGDTLVEAGFDVAYIEHWHRDSGRAIRASAVHLKNVTTGSLACSSARTIVSPSSRTAQSRSPQQRICRNSCERRPPSKRCRALWTAKSR